MQALYPAEVLSYESRAKGLAFLNVVAQASSCINTFAYVYQTSAVGVVLTFDKYRMPVALEKIAWKGRHNWELQRYLSFLPLHIQYTSYSSSGTRSKWL